MKSFTHINVQTVSEACTLLGRYDGKAMLNAGGTDLLSILKNESLIRYPEALINIKSIRGLDLIERTKDGLRIGALARLSEIAASPLITEGYGVLARAAGSVASPQIRNAGTIGGNLCQAVRCSYYRYPRQIGGPVICARKGKGRCFALTGDNRNHAILQAKNCFAVCPSDTAVALAALDARIVIVGLKGIRRIAIADLYKPLSLTLDKDEMVTHIMIPELKIETRQRFIKFTLSKPGDFALVSVASAITTRHGLCEDARIVIGAVAPGPVRAVRAERSIVGRRIDEKGADEAARQAVSGARPLSGNAYKVEIAKALVKRAVLS
jgi:xanthine dehydrogenase YagS FAD-binding subunit